MNLLAILGLGLIGTFIIWMLIFNFWPGIQEEKEFREISGFSRLLHNTGLAVETGKRVHLSLGWGNIVGPRGPIAFAGLNFFERMVHFTLFSDRGPLATSGEGSLAILAQDTLRRTALDRGGNFNPAGGRVTGLTPWSYAAGTLVLIHEESIGVNTFVGSFGSEIGLLAEAGERSRSFTLAGTDNLTGQAVLFATAEEPLIGEEAFAGGAYMDLGKIQIASLKAQDLFRWLLIAIILVGTLLNVAGMQ